jgi:hypothetical protein
MLYEDASSGLSFVVKPAPEALEGSQAPDSRSGDASSVLGACIQRLEAATSEPASSSTTTQAGGMPGMP